MDLALTTDQELFRETTHKFLENSPAASSTRALEDDPTGFDREWWRRGAELGWTAMLAPEPLGGGGLDGEGLLDLVIVAEEIGRAVAPGPIGPVNVVADALTRVGTPDQQAILAGVVDGSTFLAWGFYEGGAWDASTVKAEAVVGDEAVRLRGSKTLVEAGNVADHFLVTARTGDGLTQVLVPADADGLTVTAMRGLDLSRRFSDLSFDLELPTSAVVGGLGAAAADVERQLQVAVVLQCAETVGAMGRVFDFTLEYLRDRYSFGRPLNSYQALKHRVADQAVALQGSFGITTAAARAVQAGAENASELVSAAKAWVGAKATDLMQDCVQLHGGIGVTWEHDIHLFLRRATVNRVTYGTPEEHCERVAALLGL